MRVARILGSPAGFYDRKCLAIDALTLDEGRGQSCSVTADRERVQWSGQTETFETAAERLNGSADLIHAYGVLPPRLLRKLKVPLFSEFMASPQPSRWVSMLRKTSPAVTPERAIPEAVDDSFFVDTPRSPLPGRVRIGSLAGGRDLRRMIELSIVRFSRFRDDIDWDLFDEAPEVFTLRELSLWVDPGSDENDRDGFVAEALVAGLPVVASASSTNEVRLEGGRSGFLVPPGDPNELVHAALTALFKDEVCLPRLAAARESRERFRSSHRRDALLQAYREIVP